MVLIQLALAFLLFVPQEEKKEEKIIVTVPEFYLRPSMPVYGYGIRLESCPSGISRRYYVRALSQYGEIEAMPREVSEGYFYVLTRSILSYGVMDNFTYSFQLNLGYINFLKFILEKNIITQENLVGVCRSYVTDNKNWVESAYYCSQVLQDVDVGIDWENVENLNKNNANAYFYALALIMGKKIPIADISARVGMDGILRWEEIRKKTPDDYFNHFAKAYGELIRRGYEMPEDLRYKLFQCSLDANLGLDIEIPKLYIANGLPLPKKEFISEALTEFVVNSKDPVPNVVWQMRKLGIAFPQEEAKRYRDSLLRNDGALDDIEYLTEMAKEEANPKLWKRYADTAFWWHKSKENRKQSPDSVDYFHIAVVAYRKFIKVGGRLSDERVEELLKEKEDFSVRTADIITVYELKGATPKSSKSILEILEERIEKCHELTVNREIVYGTFWKHGEVRWRLNEYGQKRIPFQDEIELAAYLDDPERTRKLSHKISFYALEKTKKEGLDLAPFYKDDLNKFNMTMTFLKWLLDFDSDKAYAFYLQKYLKEKLRTSYSPAYVELSAIIDLYESLKFTNGARSLAQHLHSVGFKMPARRAFRIGGFEKEAEEQYFNWKDDAYWLKQEEEFNYKIRKRDLENNIEKTGRTHWASDELKSTIRVKDKK